MPSFANRIFRALQLEDRLYEEVAADPRSLGQATALVVLSSFAAGVGNSGGHPENILTGTIVSLIGWYLWTFLIYLIGVKVFPGPETKGGIVPLLRTTGFASSPGVIRIFGFLPAVSVIVVFGASLWLIGAMVIAVRHTFRYQSVPHAIGVSIIAWIIYQAVRFGLSSLAKTGGL
ncbi:MAG: hypothetical protein ACE5HN_03520 [Nitrospiria bacterium]